MAPKITRMQTGERVLREFQDNSGWLTRKMGTTSEGSGVSKDIGPAPQHGTIFLTNRRIIFESLDANIVESHLHEDIERTKGKDGGFTRGDFQIIKTNGNITRYTLYCGEEFSNHVNQQFYNSEAVISRNMNLALERVKHLDYEGAIQIYESIGKLHEAARVRKFVTEKGKIKVDQTVVHGDYVDDRDTIVKDSVINRSNVGSGGDDKFTRLEKLTEMKKEGLIDDGEFKQMKKEILGK